jgi:hypothetical protein
MPETADCVPEVADRVVDIGDLDFTRNLKIRAFLALVLAPVFRNLQPRIPFAAMGRRGITPGQYFQDFENVPAAFGYGDRFTGHYEVRLCRSVSERRGPRGEPQRLERLILETRATLTGRLASAPPAALGFEPSLGAPATAGTGRVIHVLTRPQAPPGQRWVTEVPEELAFLALHPLDGPFPTMDLLRELEAGFIEIRDAAIEVHGLWGVANSDVFQHVHAREYTVAMENGLGLCLAGAKIPLESQFTTRSRVIFRRPSFVGQRYTLSIKLYRRGLDIVALGAFYGADDPTRASEDGARVLLRFDGRLSEPRKG